MTQDREKIEFALEKAIQKLAEERGQQLAKAIASIVFANLERGRVQYYLNIQLNCSPADYVHRVVNYYEQWHDYLIQVQVEQQRDVWEQLYEKLQKWAYNHMRRKGFPPQSNERYQHAVDCAAEAGSKLLHARFPYDVDFDPWACVLLQNISDKYMARVRKQYQAALEHLVSVDKWSGWLEQLQNPSSPNEEETIELHYDLLRAIEQLSSEARKQVILLHYFEEYSFKQIADKLGKSYGAVHKLHFDALNNLRKIWTSSWDKDE